MRIIELTADNGTVFRVGEWSGSRRVEKIEQIDGKNEVMRVFFEGGGGLDVFYPEFARWDKV